MIRVNLLPLDKRRPERTPLPRLIAIFAGVLVTFALAAGDVFFFIEISIQEGKLEEQNRIKEDCKNQVREYEQIKAQKEAAEQRKAAIDSIRGTRRFLWSFEIDKLSDVINDCPKVWLTSLKCGDGTPPGSLNFGPGKMKAGMVVDFYLYMECKSATDDKAFYSEFSNKLEEKFLPVVAVSQAGPAKPAGGAAGPNPPAGPAAPAPGPGAPGAPAGPGGPGAPAGPGAGADTAAAKTGSFRFLNDPDLGVESMTTYKEKVALKYVMCLVGVKQTKPAGPAGAGGS